MFGHDIQGACGDPTMTVMSAWLVASLVAAIVTAVGWLWRGTLDLKRDASILVLGCVGACLIWSAIQARRASTIGRRASVVIRSAHGEVSVPGFQDAISR